MSNRYIIKDHERGHRPRLSKDEPTVIYTIGVPRSLKNALRKINPTIIRGKLSELVNQIIKR